MLRTILVIGFVILAGNLSANGLASPKSTILAQLSPRQQTVLSSELSARVESLPLKEGMAFKVGQKLVEFDCLVGRARLEKVRAAAMAAQMKLAVIKRLKEYNSTTELEEELAAAEVAKALADVNEEAAVVSKCTLKAPFSGKVAELRVFRYQFVKAGDPLMKIIDDSVLEVQFLAPSIWFSWLKSGYTFKITVNETQSVHEATVIRVGASIDPVSHTFKVVGRINNRTTDLTAGMTGRIVLIPPSEKVL